MLEKILEILRDKNVFLTGSAGVGKSFLTREIINLYKNSSKQVVILGSTGISALNIGGITIHSFFKFRKSANLNELKAIDKKQKSALNDLGEVLRKIDLIVIDEVSMMSADLLDMVNFRLKTMNYNGRLLFVGDFFQLAPVITNKTQSLFAREYAFDSGAWAEFDFQNVLLTRQKRTQNAQFYELLSKIREYEFDDQIRDFLCSRIVKTPSDDTLILFGRNDGVDFINESRLASLRAPEREFSAKIQKISDEISEAELANWVKNIGLKPRMYLKIGARVMFSTNKAGCYYNGERGFVAEFGDAALLVKKDNGEEIIVEPATYELSEYRGAGDEVEQNVLAKFTQIPLKLAYAITIHKSQGMSLDNFTCNLDNIFAPGQLYVALSRATDPRGLFIQYTRNADFVRYFRSLETRNAAQIEAVREFYAKNTFLKED